MRFSQQNGSNKDDNDCWQIASGNSRHFACTAVHFQASYYIRFLHDCWCDDFQGAAAVSDYWRHIKATGPPIVSHGIEGGGDAKVPRHRVPLDGKHATRSAVSIRVCPLNLPFVSNQCREIIHE